MQDKQTAVQHNTDAAAYKFTEFLMQRFNDGTPSPTDPPAAGASDPPSAGAPAGDPPPAANPPAADPNKPADPPKPDEKPPGAPESYKDFTMPEGFTTAPEAMSEFQTWAKTNNLSQEAAQSAIDMYTKVAQQGIETQQAAQVAQSEAWHAESLKQYKQADIELANKTLARFATPELIEELKVTGFSNNPHLIGVFKSIGAQISEGKFVDAGGGGQPKSWADTFYGETSPKK
jgi:hypothetical protein